MVTTHCGCEDLNPGPEQEQWVLWVPELSLQPQGMSFVSLWGLEGCYRAAAKQVHSSTSPSFHPCSLPTPSSLCVIIYTPPSFHWVLFLKPHPLPAFCSSWSLDHLLATLCISYLQSVFLSASSVSCPHCLLLSMALADKPFLIYFLWILTW